MRATAKRTVDPRAQSARAQKPRTSAAGRKADWKGVTVGPVLVTGNDFTFKRVEASHCFAHTQYDVTRDSQEEQYFMPLLSEAILSCFADGLDTPKSALALAVREELSLHKENPYTAMQIVSISYGQLEPLRNPDLSNRAPPANTPAYKPVLLEQYTIPGKEKYDARQARPSPTIHCVQLPVRHRTNRTPCVPPMALEAPSRPIVSCAAPTPHPSAGPSHTHSGTSHSPTRSNRSIAPIPDCPRATSHASSRANSHRVPPPPPPFAAHLLGVLGSAAVCAQSSHSIGTLSARCSTLMVPLCARAPRLSVASHSAPSPIATTSGRSGPPATRSPAPCSLLWPCTRDCAPCTDASETVVRSLASTSRSRTRAP